MIGSGIFLIVSNVDLVNELSISFLLQYVGEKIHNIVQYCYITFNNKSNTICEK